VSEKLVTHGRPVFTGCDTRRSPVADRRLLDSWSTRCRQTTRRRREVSSSAPEHLRHSSATVNTTSSARIISSVDGRSTY